MKQTSLLFVFFCWGLGALGQKSDYVWLSGYRGSNGFAGYDSVNMWVFGHSILDFNYSPRSIVYDSLFMNLDRANVSFCNSSGDLLFYSNGIYIANQLDQKIENSDSLNYGYIMDLDPTVVEFGYRTPHGMISVQNPSNINQYYLLHVFLDTISNANHNMIGKSVWVSLLDMSLNAGLGKVIYKNQKVAGNNISFDIVGTRHGNGRDWWGVVNKRNSNCYYKILLNNQGVNLIDSTCDNRYIDYNNLSSSAFSPDGNKYAMVSYLDGVILFDFDRCSGALTNSKFIPMPFIEDSGYTALGIAFSPNGRFMYVNASVIALQYDLWAIDIAASVDTVAVFDGYRAPFGSLFHTAQLGPDGKIYISCGNGEKVYHVIERPDEKGDSCLFNQHGLLLPTFSGGVPNFPNYRLGALPSSPCDTLTGLSETARAEKERILKVFPNPASDVITVDYGFTDWNKGAVRLEIINELGQVVYAQSLPMYSGFQKIEVGGFAAGVYQVMLKRGNGVVGVSKFRKE